MTNEPRPTDPDEIARRLAEPFHPDEVKWLPKNVSGNRCLAFAYIDARLVQERLDDVLGMTNWQDEYTVTNNGDAVCTLRLRIGGEWVAKSDTGSYAENLGGEGLKAAFSDALKRTAAKFGVGRYLYRLKPDWAGYDPKTKQISRPPALPAWALPAGDKGQRPAPAAAPATTAPIDQEQRKLCLPMLELAACKGAAELDEQWKKIGQAGRTACQLEIEGLKKVAGWSDWFRADPPLPKINEAMPKLLGIKNGYVRALCLKVAREWCDQGGAEYDEKNGIFVVGYANQD